MSDYEIAIRKWAAEKAQERAAVDVQWWQIQRVVIETDPGTYGWSSWTPGEPPSFDAYIEIRKTTSKKSERIDLCDDPAEGAFRIDFDDLFREVLQIKISSEDRILWTGQAT